MYSHVNIIVESHIQYEHSSVQKSDISIKRNKWFKHCIFSWKHLLKWNNTRVNEQSYHINKTRNYRERRVKHEQLIETKMDILDKIMNGLQSVTCNIWSSHNLIVNSLSLWWTVFVVRESDDECTTCAHVLYCKLTVVYVVLSPWWPYNRLTVKYMHSIIKF